MSTGEVVILSGCRTPIGSFGGAFRDVSAVIPMWMSWNASVRPSWIMWSTTRPWPRRSPHRAPGSRNGAALMLSVPPATITSASPHLMDWAASITAFRPEPQTLFTVCAGTDSGRPALIAA